MSSKVSSQQLSKQLLTVSITSQVLTQDTGASATDDITSNGAVKLTGTTSGAAGTIVRIYDGTKLLGTATLDGKGGWTFSTTLPAGSHVLHAVASDTSGHSATSANEPAIVVEAVAPKVGIVSQVLEQDTGSNSTDRITSNGAITLSGTVSGYTGTTVQIFDGSTFLGTATLDGKGGWTYATTLAVGTHALHAVATDLAGNTTATAAQPAVTIVSPPTVGITAQILAQDTGPSATDHVTSNGAVTLIGTVSGTAGTTVQIFDGNALLGSAMLDGKGGWSCATTLGDGTHALHAVAIDPAGNSTATAAQAPITVDHTMPVVSYHYEYQVVGSHSVELFGDCSGPAGTMIEVYSGSNDLGAATITGANTWEFTTPALADGNYSFSAIATTLAGNTATFTGVPSLSVGASTGTLDALRFNTIWSQDFTTTQIDRNIFPIVYGNADQFSYGANGLTLTSYRSEGFSNVGILGPTWNAAIGDGYGLYSITASMPAQGTGVALLLWPSDNGWPGPEMDMVEDWNDPTGQTAYFSVHMKNPLDGSDLINTIQYSVDLTKQNTFALDWEDGCLTYYVNGHELFQLTGGEVPKDYAHGGVNAAFGAQVSDIGTSYEPTDQVSVTVASMSYASISPPPASIDVSSPGTILQTAPGAVQSVAETIRGTSLGSSTVYAMVLSKNNAAYVDWQAVTLDANGYGTFNAQYHATGDYLAVTTDPAHLSVLGWSAPVTLGSASDPGGILSETVSHDHLWFVRSGNDLVVDVLGTNQHTYIDNWYGAGEPFQQVQAADGVKLDAGIDSLVQAMASFAAANPAFDPATSTHTSLNDSYLNASVVTAAASSWHT